VVSRRKALMAWSSRMIAVASSLLGEPALAGPPYLSDDPEPTDYKHYEIYSLTNGTATRGSVGGETGIDINYGGAPNLQLTATIPLGYDISPDTGTRVGLSNIELAAKYRFLHQDTFGWDVAVFPRVFLPSPSKGVGDSDASFLLPIWVQKDWTKEWTTFGGGGCVFSTRSSKDFCLAGVVVTHKVTEKLQLGIELFHQTADMSGTPASTSIGLGAVYDLNDTYHLLAYVRRGIQNTSATDQLGWYAALLTTF
jgi:Putative MetA-pathway of phenol degradation